MRHRLFLPRSLPQLVFLVSAKQCFTENISAANFSLYTGRSREREKDNTKFFTSLSQAARTTAALHSLAQQKHITHFTTNVFIHIYSSATAFIFVPFSSICFYIRHIHTTRLICIYLCFKMESDRLFCIFVPPRSRFNSFLRCAGGAFVFLAAARRDAEKQTAA